MAPTVGAEVVRARIVALGEGADGERDERFEGGAEERAVPRDHYVGRLALDETGRGDPQEAGGERRVGEVVLRAGAQCREVVRGREPRLEWVEDPQAFEERDAYGSS